MNSCSWSQPCLPRSLSGLKNYSRLKQLDQGVQSDAKGLACNYRWCKSYCKVRRWRVVVTPPLKCWWLFFLFAWESSAINGLAPYLNCDFHDTSFVCQQYFLPGKACLLQPHSTVWKHQSQIKCYSVHRSVKLASFCSKSSQSQMNIWKMVKGRQSSSSVGKEQKSNWSPRWTPSIFYLPSSASRVPGQPSWEGIWKREGWKMTLCVHLAQRARGLGLLPEQRHT